jgi:K+-sensing histidine kinase KdpD
MDRRDPATTDTAGQGTAPQPGSTAHGRAARRARADHRAFFELLSHELRTPVTSIHVAAGILRTRATSLGDDGRGELIEDIADETERLLRVVDDLLVLAQLDAGVDVAREPLLLQRLVPPVLQRERRRRPDVRIELRETGTLPVVRGDELGVQQVVRDLVADVGRWWGREPVSVVLGPTEPPGAHVRVIHHGPGLGALRRARPSWRSRRAALHRPVAGGIGPYTCARLAKAMGGHSWTRPRADGGCESGLWLPAVARMTDD